MRESLRDLLKHPLRHGRRWLERHPALARTMTRTGCLSLQRYALARGVAVGIFVGLTPTVGVQTLLMLGGCLLVRGNFPAAFVASWVSNPVTIAPLYFAFRVLGETLFRPLFSPFLDGSDLVEQAALETLYIGLGSLPVAIAGAGAGYLLFLGAWLVWARRRHARRRRPRTESPRPRAGAALARNGDRAGPFPISRSRSVAADWVSGARDRYHRGSRATIREGIMWNDLIRRWLDLAFWWLPGQSGRERERHAERPDEGRESPQQASRPTPAPERPAAEPAPKPQAGPAPQAGAKAEPKPEPEPTPATATPAPETPAAGQAQGGSGPDDLTRIKGIGAAMQQRLNAHGIRSFADLAAADADWLLQQLKEDKAVISRARVEEWIRAASARGGG